MRHFLIATVAAIAVLVVAAGVPARALGAPRAMLAWDRCIENGGTVTRTFACDTNVGSETIVGSFVPPAGVTDMNGLEVVIDMLTTPETAWPDWWAFKNTGACRQSALSMYFDFMSGEGYGCEKLWASGSAGGIATYMTGYSFNPSRTRLFLLIARPFADVGPVSPDTTYDAFALTLDHSKTVGPGACSGCEAPVCATITSIKWTQPAGLGDFSHVTAGESLVLWQSAVPTCPASIPTRRSSWGALKSLYR